MRYLLVQADDFGMSEGVTAGIVEAMDRGIVTGASAMVCDRNHRAIISRWASSVRGRIGIHLQLTDGTPLSRPERVPSLVDESGRFPRRRDQLKAPHRDEILLEWRAQMQALRDLGIEPNHLDTHHTVHQLPVVVEAYRALSEENHLPVRGASYEFNRQMRDRGIPCAHQYTCLWTGQPVKPEAFCRALRVFALYTPDPGYVEIGCHPAHVDDELARSSRYTTRREEELAVLCDPQLRRSIEELGYELAGPEVLLRS